MKKRRRLRKGLAMLLSLAMVAGLVPAMSGGANKVQAATGSGTEPSVSAYATKKQLRTAFTPDENGNATTIGKLVFGKNSDGNPQEWYILGEDADVLWDNTIIFAASPIATEQKFDSSGGDKLVDRNIGVYVTSEPGFVYPNHYGASDLRVALQAMATNTNYFTKTEQGLMNATTVTTYDKNNRVTYTTTDNLYALQGDYQKDKLWAGTSDSTVLARSSYWSNGSNFWLRSPSASNVRRALLAIPGDYVRDLDVDCYHAVQPASNLNLSSVLFASAAQAASSDTAESYTIALEAAMTLRLDGTGKDIGTVTYNTTTGDIKAVKGSTSQTVALVVQGKGTVNGEEKDWYYSKQITGTDTVNVSDIEAETYTPTSIDLSACKIWLEITEDNVSYAINATGHTDEDKDGKCDTCGTYLDGIGAKLAGYSLSLNGNIGVNFYMELSGEIAGNENAFMEFTLPNTAEKTKVYVKGTHEDGATATTSTVGAKTYYVFSCEVAAKEMTDEIQAQMIAGEDKGTVYTYTVKDYADYILSHTESYDEKVVTVVKAMLNYGACSQTYFGYQTEKLANASLEEVAKTLPNLTADQLSDKKATVTKNEAVCTFASAYLTLQSETAVHVYVKLADGVSKEDVTFSIDGNVIAKENLVKGTGTYEGYYILSVDNIQASALDDMHTFSVMAGEQTASLSYGPMSYCYSILAGDSASDDLKNVVKALYAFNQAADSYVAN